MSQNTECCICYRTVSAGNKITTECNHVFHNTCLTKWLLIHEDCPLCRNDLCKTNKDNLELDNYEQDPEDEIESLVYVQRSIKRLPFSFTELEAIADWEYNTTQEIINDNESESPQIPSRHCTKLKPLHTKDAITSVKVKRTYNCIRLYIQKKEKTNTRCQYNYTKNTSMMKHIMRKCMGDTPCKH